jgi:predicted metal-dependent hydrolase
MQGDGESIALKLANGVEAFNRQDFFTSHDLLEDVWMDVRGEERRFFQGLVQLAIGYYHQSCENPTGARNLLGRGLDKLAGWPPSHRGLDVASLTEAVAASLSALDQGTQDPGFPEIRKAGREE